MQSGRYVRIQWPNCFWTVQEVTDLFAVRDEGLLPVRPRVSIQWSNCFCTIQEVTDLFAVREVCQYTVIRLFLYNSGGNWSLNSQGDMSVHSDPTVSIQFRRQLISLQSGRSVSIQWSNCFCTVQEVTDLFAVRDEGLLPVRAGISIQWSNCFCTFQEVTNFFTVRAEGLLPVGTGVSIQWSSCFCTIQGVTDLFAVRAEGLLPVGTGVCGYRHWRHQGQRGALWGGAGPRHRSSGCTVLLQLVGCFTCSVLWSLSFPLSLLLFCFIFVWKRSKKNKTFFSFIHVALSKKCSFWVIKVNFVS